MMLVCCTCNARMESQKDRAVVAQQRRGEEDSKTNFLYRRLQTCQRQTLGAQRRRGETVQNKGTNGGFFHEEETKEKRRAMAEFFERFRAASRWRRFFFLFLSAAITQLGVCFYAVADILFATLDRRLSKSGMIVFLPVPAPSRPAYTLDHGV